MTTQFEFWLFLRFEEMETNDVVIMVVSTLDKKSPQPRLQRRHGAISNDFLLELDFRMLSWRLQMSTLTYHAMVTHRRHPVMGSSLAT